MDIFDTQYNQLYHGSSGPPLNLTLEGQLLSQWSSGSPHYDGIYFHYMPPLEQLLSSLGASPVLTLLVNQSAVSGLPAALNQATTALLRVMVAAGGGRKSSLAASSSSGVGLGKTYNTSTSPSSCIGQHGVHDSSKAGAACFHRTGSNFTAGRALADIPAGGSSAASGAAAAAGVSAAGGGVSGSAGGGHLPSCLPDITVSSAPLPLLRGEAEQRVREDAGALMLVLCMTMAASVLSASFVVFLVR